MRLVQRHVLVVQHHARLRARPEMRDQVGFQFRAFFGRDGNAFGQQRGRRIGCGAIAPVTPGGIVQPQHQLDQPVPAGRVQAGLERDEVTAVATHAGALDGGQAGPGRIQLVVGYELRVRRCAPRRAHDWRPGGIALAQRKIGRGRLAGLDDHLLRIGLVTGMQHGQFIGSRHQVDCPVATRAGVHHVGHVHVRVVRVHLGGLERAIRRHATRQGAGSIQLAGAGRGSGERQAENDEPCRCHLNLHGKPPSLWARPQPRLLKSVLS